MKQKSKRKPVNHKKFSRKMQTKLVQLFLLIALALFGLAMRLLYINDSQGHNYTVQVLAQQTYESKTLPYQRGSITDRNGTILAASEKIYNLILDAKIMNSEDGKYLNTTLTALNGCFGYDVGELSALIAENPDSQYIVYKKGMTYDEIKDFQNLKNGKLETMPSWFPEDYKYTNIQGVWFEEEYKRNYPYSTLACDLLGFVNSGDEGVWGIEQQYNDELNGTNGRTYGYLNSDSALEKVIKPATDGNTIVSTIDINLQMIAEKYVQDYYETVGAKNVAVLMMDPNNGEILAEATAPWFDLNNPRDLTAYYTEEELKAMPGE
ncbi:MAG: peptidoglycan glycosyltransferase, partial [Lachnospiraceae bacterium]|nr:peptidoglycan glycosyltransferase [Lachnospiraceae bacterium]